MLKAYDPDRSEDQDQQELCPSDFSSHLDKYPFIKEFSEFISTVPTNALISKLMTHQQRLLAKSLWEAENYGGSESKCIERLKDIYGYHWKRVTSLSDHMAPFREYCEYVLILEHQKQWNERKKVVTVGKITSTDASAADRDVAGRAGKHGVPAFTE
jgi:hypothetical protein